MIDGRQQFTYLARHATLAKRHYLSQCLREATGSVVQYGLLKGFEVGAANWAEAAVGAYLLGTYEPQVCALLDRLRSPDLTLVDIGAADGLYGVGLVAVGAFGRSICFEIDAAQQQSLGALSARLGLADKVAVHGAATGAALREALARQAIDPAATVVICDIEGAEFELFDDALLEFLADAHVIIETHDFLRGGTEDGRAAFERLKRRAGTHFNVHEVKDGLRDMRNIPLLKGWSDMDTWTMCMEGRARMMTWLYLTPLDEARLTPAELDATILAYQQRMFGPGG